MIHGGPFEGQSSRTKRCSGRKDSAGVLYFEIHKVDNLDQYHLNAQRSISDWSQGRLAAKELQVQVPLTFIMPPTTIRSAPAFDSFTSLEDHQSQTPASFYGMKPVLHHHIIGASVRITRDQMPKLPVFHSANAAVNGGATGTGSSTTGEGTLVQDGYSHLGNVIVDVFVSSE